MPKFFIDAKPVANKYKITGEDAKHITKSLRMKLGEDITLCYKGVDYYAKVSKIEKDYIEVDIFKELLNKSEPNVKLHLFIAFPKSNKLETIVQKATELGVSEITPFLSQNTVVKLDAKEREKKRERLVKIAKNAAMQSNRGEFVKINEIKSFTDCIKQSVKYDCRILFYEKTGNNLKSVDFKYKKNICAFVGSEGGFSDSEVTLAEESKINIVNLGNRILRCETAAITSCGLIMFLSGNM